MSAPVVTHVLSFDIEDWFHIVDVPSVADRERWDDFPSLVERYTDLILERLESAEKRGTFFVLGWIADRYPALLRRIADHGHEIGCHSYWHPRVELLSPEAFREDTQRAADTIAQLTGTKVRGYRAPSFSITPGTEWAFDVLLDLGFEYDASLFPGKRGHGGYPCPQEAHEFRDTPSGRPLLELPMSLLSLGPVKLAFSGGGYLRVLPFRVIQFGFDRFARRGIPAVLYLHPRDFAQDTPRVPMPPHRRFKCYTGLNTTLPKFDALLRRYEFGTCAQVLGLE